MPCRTDLVDPACDLDIGLVADSVVPSIVIQCRALLCGPLANPLAHYRGGPDSMDSVWTLEDPVTLTRDPLDSCWTITLLLGSCYIIIVFDLDIVTLVADQPPRSYDLCLVDHYYPDSLTLLQDGQPWTCPTLVGPWLPD